MNSDIIQGITILDHKALSSLGQGFLMFFEGDRLNCNAHFSVLPFHLNQRLIIISCITIHSKNNSRTYELQCQFPRMIHLSGLKLQSIPWNLGQSVLEGLLDWIYVWHRRISEYETG